MGGMGEMQEERCLRKKRGEERAVCLRKKWVERKDFFGLRGVRAFVQLKFSNENFSVRAKFFICLASAPPPKIRGGHAQPISKAQRVRKWEYKKL